MKIAKLPSTQKFALVDVWRDWNIGVGIELKIVEHLKLKE